MASSKCLHPILERAVESRSSIVIYGPAGTGKTRIAFRVYTCSPGGLRPVIVATEPGTLIFSRHYGIPVVEALSIDELVRVVTEIVAEGRYPIVDTINWHYRSSPGPDTGRAVAYISALLASVGGLAVAQVSGEGEASGSQYILPWMEYIASTGKLGEAKFKLTLHKPYKRVIVYRLRGREIEWV